MKKIILFLLTLPLLLSSCDGASKEVDALKAEIETLKKQVESINLEETAKEALDSAKQEVDTLKEELKKVKEDLEKKVAENEQISKALATVKEYVKKDDPVSVDEATALLEPLGLRLEKKDNPEFKGVIGHKQGNEGEVFYLFYALANQESKALELFQEQVQEEGDYVKVKDEDDKIYTLEEEGEVSLALLDDKAFFFAKGKSLDKLKEIALSLGLDLD